MILRKNEKANRKLTQTVGDLSKIIIVAVGHHFVQHFPRTASRVRNLRSSSFDEIFLGIIHTGTKHTRKYQKHEETLHFDCYIDRENTENFKNLIKKKS